VDKHIYTSDVIDNTMLAFYAFLMFVTIIVTLGMPVDRGLKFYKFNATIISIFILCGFFAVTEISIKQGFYSEELIRIPGTNEWEHTGIYNLNLAVAACFIFIFTLFVPAIYRPVDFSRNIFYYLAGLVTFVLFTPTMINIMHPYSAANLHDVSWGNRPDLKAESGSNGVEAFTAREEKQEQIKGEYQYFRAKYLVFWTSC